MCTFFFYDVKFEAFLHSTHFEISLDIALLTSLVGYFCPRECKRPTKLIASKTNDANSFLRHILVFHKANDR